MLEPCLCCAVGAMDGVGHGRVDAGGGCQNFRVNPIIVYVLELVRAPQKRWQIAATQWASF
jgi:hypothetical protein